MKIQKLVAVAALGLTAGTAWAQSHPSAPGIASSTVGGIFVPAPAATTASAPRGGGGVTVTAPATTPVSVAPLPVTPSTPAPVAAATATVNAVISGASSAGFTQALGAAGVPSAAAQGIATALQQLSATPTVGSVVTAVASWNAAIATMSPEAVVAFVSSPQGMMATRAIANAYRAATSTP